MSANLCSANVGGGGPRLRPAPCTVPSCCRGGCVPRREFAICHAGQCSGVSPPLLIYPWRFADFTYRSALDRRDVMPGSLRFPPPRTAEETDACFIVRDLNGQALAYVYFEEEPGRRSAANLLTRDEARRIAANVAKIPKFRHGGTTS
jgi:hypothetical protein